MKTAKRNRAAVPAIILVLALMLCMLPMSVFADTVPASSTTFTFANSGITASGETSGYEIDGTALKITASGVYTVTGACAEGSITVKKGTTDVTLVLQDLTLSCSTTAPLSCNKGTETTLCIVGTVTLNDNESLDNEDSDDFEGAAIKVKSENSSLTITGTGTLNVNGNCKNGIKGAATATVAIESGILNVKAANHGIASDGAVVIKGGTVNITAGNEGIKASPDEDDTESAGNITISGGTVRITADDDGIHADGNLKITGGTVTVSAGDDGLKAEYDVTISGGTVTVSNSYEGVEGATVNLMGGSGRITASDDGVNAANSDLSGYSFQLNIAGGTWYVNAGGDGLDSNGSVTISGGTTEVYAAANDGNGALDSETGITYSGGTVLAVGMSGMAETPSSGTYVAFGASGFGGGMMGGMPGEQPGNFGGQQPGNFGGPQGGFGRMSNTDSASATVETTAFQPGQMGGFGQQQSTGSVSISAGDSLVIKDSSGNTLYSATAVKSANSVVFATDGLVSGESYTLYVNGSAAATATAAAGSGMGGGMMGGMPGQNGTMGAGEMPELPDGDQLPEQRNGQTPVAGSDTEEVGAAIDSGLATQNLQRNYQGSVTRGDVAQMFINLIEQASGENIDSFLAEHGAQIDNGAFTDTHDRAVLAANALGIINGTGNGAFSPNATLTRAQLAAILGRVAGVMGQDTTGYTHSFTDVTGHWVSTELGWAVQNGIINGRGNGIFDPDTPVTTQEAIAITYRALGALR